MHETTTIRRMTARTAAALLLAVVGMLALGGAWTSAFADAGGNPNGGANNSGPYDPGDVCGGTNQGNSQNCNGSVGNADDKNPPGQVDNTHDRGYECDDNKGVGDHGGNPAHTGCETTTTSTVRDSSCTQEPCDHNPGCTSNCGTPSVTPNTPGEAPSAEVLGLTEEQPGAAPAAAVGPASELAFTGSTADALGFVALALLAFGGSFLLVARKPTEVLAS